ncbi:hypothetical protein DAPPUDRAFT_280700, partial [Daphnia pulex]
MVTPRSRTVNIASGQAFGAGRFAAPPGPQLTIAASISAFLSSISASGASPPAPAPAPAAPSASNWAARSAIPGKTVWSHNFSNPGELTAFKQGNGTGVGDRAHVGPAIEPFIVDDPITGKAIRFIALGARLTSAFLASGGPGPRPIDIDDDYLWPDPALKGAYTVHLCDPDGGQDNNLVRITAKSGLTLTATWVNETGQPLTNGVQRDWPVGTHIGGQSAVNWSRHFSALKGDSNGRGVDDINLAGNVLRSMQDQTNFPHGTQAFGYGWYGRPEYQAEHATWRPSDSGAQAIDSILRSNLWDGDSFTLSWRQK